MKIATPTLDSPCPPSKSQPIDQPSQWTPAGLAQKEAGQGSPGGFAHKKISYKEKFRARVKSVLKNVRDLEIEEYDQQQRQATESQVGENSTENAGASTLSNGLGLEDDLVDSSNSVVFVRKAFLIMGLQLLISTIWISSVCPNDKLFTQFYEESTGLTVVAAAILLCIFSSLYFTKKVFGSKGTHIVLSSTFTLSLSYSVGALSAYISYKTMAFSFIMSLSFIAGLVTYCKLTSDAAFNVRKSSLCGFSFLLLTSAALYLWSDVGTLTLVFLWVVTSIFGLALVVKAHLLSQRKALDNLLMKHYIFFAMLLYIDFLKTVAYAAINTFGYTARSLPKPEASSAEAQTDPMTSNLFAFTNESESDKQL